MWALVRITPLLSIRTPLPEMGLNKPPVLEVQIILTIAVRTFSLSSLKFIGLTTSTGGSIGWIGMETSGLLIGGGITDFFLSGIIFCVVVEIVFSLTIGVVDAGKEMFSVKFADGEVAAEKKPIISPRKTANTSLKNSIKPILLILSEPPKKVV